MKAPLCKICQTNHYRYQPHALPKGKIKEPVKRGVKPHLVKS